jgi:hypothetical protein
VGHQEFHPSALRHFAWIRLRGVVNMRTWATTNGRPRSGRLRMTSAAGSARSMSRAWARRERGVDEPVSIKAGRGMLTACRSVATAVSVLTGSPVE